MNPHPNERRLNIAGKMASFFVNSKLTLLIIIGTLIFGAGALKYTPRTYNPEIVVPVVNITVSRPGSTAEEMLNQIVRPLEALMASIPKVDHTYGMAVDDSALVTVRFNVSSNEEDSLVKLYNQINSNLDKLPSGTSMPLLQSASLYDVPLVTLSLSSKHHSPSELRELGNHVLEQLRNIPFVGKSWIGGAAEPAVHVWLDVKKLEEFHIPLDQVKKSLEGNNVGIHAGALEPQDHHVPVRIDAVLMNPEQVGEILVGVYDTKPIQLKDVARIEQSASTRDIQSYFANPSTALEPAVVIAIARQKGSNGVTLSREILSKLATLEKTLIPDDITVTVTRDYGYDADEAVDILVEHLAIAVLGVVIILMIFLGWREASIVAISIPLILGVVLGISWLCGFTMNRVTVFSLILTLGLLVDDSIVVIENIHRHTLSEQLNSFTAMIVQAANEIGIPTIVATITVILALVPMAFVTGMMGPFISPIPFNAPIAMITSLLIAYSVVPYLARRWMKKTPKAQCDETQDYKEKNGIYRFYANSMGRLIQSQPRRHAFYLAVVIALLAVCLLPAWQFIKPSGMNGPLSHWGVALKMLPDDNVNTLLLEVDAVPGSSIDQTREITEAMGQVLLNNQYVTNYQIFLGESAPQDFDSMVKGDYLHRGVDYAQIRVNLTNKHQRRIGSHAIAQELYASLEPVQKSYPGTRIKLFETPPGPPVESQMQAAIYGPDYEKLRGYAEQISRDVYPRIYGMINIDNSVTENTQEYRVVIDQNEAIHAGLSPAVIASELKGYLGGLNVGHIHVDEARDTQDILLKLAVESRENISSVENLLFMNTQSDLVPLMKVATIDTITQRKPILTRDQHPVTYVSGEMLHGSPVYGVFIANQLLGKEIQVENLGFKDAIPEDIQHYQMHWLGEMRLTLDVVRDLGSILLVTLILIYFLLVAVYHSFALPLIIMGAIPLTLIGVFPGHWIMQQPFTATSMIGVIALAGIVVRNSLLLIDFIIHHQKEGMPLEQSVLESGLVRLLPIVLTAMAIILGSGIMVLDPIFGGLAISLIFGAFASTVLTLYLIPLIYYGWYKRFGGGDL